MLYGLTDVIFDCITAAAIHALPHPQGGDKDYLGLSILLGLMSIVSFVGVDCILAISTDGSKGYEGSSSWTKGLLRWSQLHAVRMMFEDATTVYAISRVGGVSTFDDGWMAQVSLGFSMFQFGLVVLVFTFVTCASACDCGWVSAKDRAVFAKQPLASCVGMLVVMALPITMMYYGSQSFGSAGVHIECRDSILDDDGMFDDDLADCGTPNGGCPTGVWLLTIVIGAVMGVGILVEDDDDDDDLGDASAI